MLFFWIIVYYTVCGSDKHYGSTWLKMRSFLRNIKEMPSGDESQIRLMTNIVLAILFVNCLTFSISAFVRGNMVYVLFEMTFGLAALINLLLLHFKPDFLKNGGSLQLLYYSYFFTIWLFWATKAKQDLCGHLHFLFQPFLH